MTHCSLENPDTMCLEDCRSFAGEGCKRVQMRRAKLKGETKTEIKDFWKLKEDPNWQPYCLVCPTMQRMKPKPYGFKCVACGNEINRDMTHHD